MCYCLWNLDNTTVSLQLYLDDECCLNAFCVPPEMYACLTQNTVAVIQGLTGTSIGLQPCLGISWYKLDSNIARVYTNKARIDSVKALNIPSEIYSCLTQNTVGHTIAIRYTRL